jgi:hypothetical protein
MAFSLSDWDGSGGGGKLPVKAELTTSPGISALDGPTTNVKSGTQKSTVKTAVKPTKTRAMRKRDLTEQEYFNPPTPTYSSGDVGISLLSRVPGVTSLPIIGEKIKKAATEQEGKIGSIELDVLARNPWLFNVPVLGNYIKDRAFRAASTGEGTVKTGESIAASDMQAKGMMDYKNYRNRLSLLRQYIYGDQDLPKAPFTPSDDYYKFLPTYSLKQKLGSSKINDYFGNIVNMSNAPTQPIKFNNRANTYLPEQQRNSERFKGLLADLENVTKTGKPKFYSGTTTNTKNLPLNLFYNSIPDFGHYKSGFAMDKELGLPYAFVADAWDFYPQDYEKFWNQDADPNNPEKLNTNPYSTSAYQQAFLMHKAGNPYKIYERSYIDPKTKRIISDEEILKRRNMLKSMKRTK